MSENIVAALENLNALLVKISQPNGFLTTTIWGALAVIVAAIIAAIIARELKISEFRQAWINDLREDLSEYLSKAYEWINLYEAQNGMESLKKEDLSLTLVRVENEAFRLLWRVEMRFKPNDEKATKLLNKLRELLSPINCDVQMNGESKWREIVSETVMQSRDLLKEEWEMTKNPWRKFNILGRLCRPSVTKTQNGGSSEALQAVQFKVSRIRSIYCYFLGVCISAAILFFCAVGLVEPFKNLALYMNDSDIAHTTSQWVEFVFLVIPASIIWAAIWLLFKGSEKKFLEEYFKNSD